MKMTLHKIKVNMIEIRNLDGKKVCCIDAEKKAVEIIIKGYMTQIVFLPDGKVSIKNEITNN